MQQPPLTRLLRGLEAELGTRLLRRLPRGVQPNEAGLVLLEEARAVLAQAARAEERVRQAARGEAGRLGVGFTSSAVLHPVVPAALRSFRADLPGVRLELDEAGTAELIESVLSGRLDAAFVRSPAEGLAGLLVEPVLVEPMVAALPAAHRLARPAPAPLRLAELAADAFILYRRRTGPGLYDAILAACRDSGFAPHIEQEAPRLPATLSLVAAGLGVSVVPESMRRHAVAGVAYRAIDPGIPAPIHLVLRRTALAATTARFRATVRHVMADHPAWADPGP
jgi:DNA-binding transcriptional LysR family regulator